MVEKEQHKKEEKIKDKEEKHEVHHEEHHEVRAEESQAVKQIRKNPWIIATFVFVIISLVLLYFVFKGGAGTVVSSQDIGKKGVDFINTQLLQGQGLVILESVADKGSIYEVNVLFENKTVPAYFTKDGGYFVGITIVPLVSSSPDLTDPTTPTQPTAPAVVNKSDKPNVELFVMTECPYGTQAEKGVLPAMKALGNKINFKIRFVHYFMHGAKEETETYTQICLRDQQSSKYYAYLECYLEDGNSTRCLRKYSINVESCVKNNAKELYAADSKLSNDYGVQGSPTLVINGVETQFYPRSPSNALSVICSAFNTSPSECDETLSTANPDPGFGTTSSSGSAGTAASCG